VARPGTTRHAEGVNWSQTICRHSSHKVKNVEKLGLNRGTKIVYAIVGHDRIEANLREQTIKSIPGVKRKGALWKSQGTNKKRHEKVGAKTKRGEGKARKNKSKRNGFLEKNWLKT